MYSLTQKEFIEKCAMGNVVPLYREVIADLHTPVSAFYKIGGPDKDYSFMLESVEGGEKWARYTFLGTDPSIIFSYSNKDVTITENGQTKNFTAEGDPLDELEKIMGRFNQVVLPGLPPFAGGAVGFLSYDAVRYFEVLPEAQKDELDTPDAVFFVTDMMIAFDNISHSMKVIKNVVVGDGADIEKLYADSCADIDSMVATLEEPVDIPRAVMPEKNDNIFEGNVTREEHEARVARCKEYIKAGDIFQVVLAQRLSKKIEVPPFDIYRALRRLNPSPYMYYLNCGKLSIVGASPESLVRVHDGEVMTRPIAGTRRRGKSEAEDKTLELELLADEKELAEHVMLIDLGRNDIGRVSKGGTVKLLENEKMQIERYSHVMHIVSTVRGELKDGMSAYSALRACFPAGTLSGAPKIRAMEIITEMENTRRGVYGGAVGYFSFDGNMDVAIAIRTLQIQNKVAYLGAGGGIVADSDPGTEYEETMNKGMASMMAVKIAENGLEPIES